MSEWSIHWQVQYQSWCPSRCCTESSNFHNCYGSLIKGIQSCLPLVTALCRWSGVDGRDIRRLEKEADNLEDNIEAKGFHVYLNKTNLICSKHNSPVKSDPVKLSCSICCKGVGSNSIFCQSCNHCVHKICWKIKVRLRADPSFNACSACTNNIIVISQDGPEAIIRINKFERVDFFRYLGHFIGQLRSYFEATTDRVRVTLKNFHSLPQVLTK